MSPEQRAELQRRAHDLADERDGLKRQPGPKLREELQGLPPHERERALRRHQLRERRRAGRDLRKELGAKRAGRLDRLLDGGPPRPFHEIRVELRGEVEGRVLDRLGATGELTLKERQRIEGLRPRQRMLAMVKIHRARIVAAIERDGLPAGIEPKAWERLKAVKGAEDFIRGAHRLGLDRIAPPPGGGPPFGHPALRELGELLHPTPEDHLIAAGFPEDQEHAIMDTLMAARVRKALAGADGIPSDKRAKLEGLSDTALMRKLRRQLGPPPR